MYQLFAYIDCGANEEKTTHVKETINGDKGYCWIQILITTRRHEILNSKEHAGARCSGQKGPICLI